jgi:anti-anti-sigma factor
MGHEPLLVVRSEPISQGVCLYVHGELDLSVVDILSDQLAAAEAAGHRVINLDLEALNFMDSSGLSVCIAASQRAANGGWRLDIVKPAPGVRRVFEISGLSVLLNDSDSAGNRGEYAP